MKNRSSNIELLRIIAALFVLSYHTVNATIDINALELPSRFIMTGLFFGMGRISVNIFVIISAWFLCKYNFKLERITNTWLSTIFYTVPIAITFVYFGKADLVYLITNMFPVFFQPLWFITTYVFLLFLTPLLNLILSKYEKRKCRNMIIFLSVLFVLPMTFLPRVRGAFYSEVGWFCVLYLITGYLRIYQPLKIVNNKKICLLVFIISYLFIISWYILYYDVPYKFLSNYLEFAGITYASFLNFTSSLPSFFASFSFFFLFKNMNITKLNNVINYISKTSLDVYILLSLKGPSDLIFWVDIFDLDVYINSGNIFMNVTIVIIAAFVITSLIGRIRIYIVDKIMQLMPKLDGIF
ncbi:acyltransferase family protein [[Clostridium] innocuum]|uniref:Acyltransferase family protein n=1 Tax=Clostridium innocuum TaxID=1522 RepID=A0AAP2USX6_CLOIN|nr:acyltransferase family protein [[Clostridium] innocuum]